MGTRSTALIELTRLWLQARHGCLVDDSIPVPVPVPFALSDIDLIALRPTAECFWLPNGEPIGPRLIVETKDEHDWEPTGKEFAKLFAKDMARLDLTTGVIPVNEKDVKFSMLRKQHFEVAAKCFGKSDFDRLFILHAFSAETLCQLKSQMAVARIHVVSAKDLVKDLVVWYELHPRKAALRNTMVGDLLHLLVGFCGLNLQKE